MKEPSYLKYTPLMIEKQPKNDRKPKRPRLGARTMTDMWQHKWAVVNMWISTHSILYEMLRTTSGARHSSASQTHITWTPRNNEQKPIQSLYRSQAPIHRTVLSRCKRNLTLRWTENQRIQDTMVTILASHYRRTPGSICHARKHARKHLTS